MLKSLNMKRELKKYLNSLEEKELINEIVKLYDKFKLVKQYYELELGNDSSKLLDEFKEKIRKEYLPTRGFGRAIFSILKIVFNLDASWMPFRVRFCSPNPPQKQMRFSPFRSCYRASF